MDRIAKALARLGEVTAAAQAISIAITHVANHHEVLGKGAAEGASRLGEAIQVADRLAGAAERFVTVVEREAPRFVDAVVKLAEERGRREPWPPTS